LLTVTDTQEVATVTSDMPLSWLADWISSTDHSASQWDGETSPQAVS